MKVTRGCRWLLWLWLVCLSLSAVADEVVCIGVLAYRPRPQTLA